MDKTALITGASRGIGAAVAMRLASSTTRAPPRRPNFWPTKSGKPEDTP